MLTRLMIAVVISGTIGVPGGVWPDLGQEAGSIATGGQLLTHVIKGEALASARGQAEPDPPETEPVRLPTEEPTIEPTKTPTPMSGVIPTGLAPTPTMFVLPADRGTVFPPSQVIDTPTALPTIEPTDDGSDAQPDPPETEPMRVTDVPPTEPPESGNGNGNGGAGNFPLYVGIGAALVLAVGAGVVFGTRRSNR